MPSKRLDLFLGGDLGLWCLRRLSTDTIGSVVTVDGEVAKTARGLGLRVVFGDANLADYSPSQNGLSVHYPIILRKDLIAKYAKIYNIHPGFLPWGRGFYPIFWALWENTPAGATLHEITAALDKGPIVDQIRVSYEPHDTGGTLFQRVRKAEQELFDAYCDDIANGFALPVLPQPAGGTYHGKRDFVKLKEQADWESMSAEDLIRLARCLTFPNYSGLELNLGGKRFHLQLEEFTN